MFKEVVFKIGEGLYSIDLNEVQEIVQNNTYRISKVPNEKPHILGSALIRGKLHTIIDGAKLLNIESGDANKTLVFETDGYLVGMEVDEIVGILDFEEDIKLPELYRGDLFKQAFKFKDKTKEGVEKLILKVNLESAFKDVEEEDFVDEVK